MGRVGKHDGLIMVGAAAAAYYFLIYKKQKAAAAGDLGGGGSFDLGNLLNSILGGITGQFASPFPQISTLQEQAAANQYAPRTPEANTARWVTSPTVGTPTLAGITSFGAYNPAAIQAAPTAKLTDMGAAVKEISSFAKASGGSVGTAYSAGGAIPIAVVPVKGSTNVGLYTTIEAYTAQATGKAPTSATVATVPAMAALSPAQRLARGLM